MNSHRSSESDPVDLLIGWYLKRWIEQHSPPEDSREKLLSTAGALPIPIHPQAAIPWGWLVRFGRLLNALYTWPWHRPLTGASRSTRFSRQMAFHTYPSGAEIFSLIS
jgi:hypothetical protein